MNIPGFSLMVTDRSTLNWIDRFDFSWPAFGAIDDVRPALSAARSSGHAVALSTLIAADGPSPRPVGTRMVVDPCAESIVGYVSGDCVEATVARLALRTLEDGRPQRLVFGRGSPFFDVRLTCGSRIEICLERIPPDDNATGVLLEGWQARQPILLQLDLDSGARECHRLDPNRAALKASGVDVSGRWFHMVSTPTPKLIIAGADPVGLALADIGLRLGWIILINRPGGPDSLPEHLSAAHYHRTNPTSLFASERIDTWTAIICTNHDIELDHAVLVHALRGSAFYVGVLGSRTKLAERRERLRIAGLSPEEIKRLHAPVGLSIGAQTPNEIAIAIWADLIRALRHE